MWLGVVTAHRLKQWIVVAAEPVVFQLARVLFGGVFGEDAYIGPYAMIEADKVLLVALLRHAHAVTFF